MIERRIAELVKLNVLGRTESHDRSGPQARAQIAVYFGEDTYPFRVSIGMLALVAEPMIKVKFFLERKSQRAGAL